MDSSREGLQVNRYDKLMQLPCLHSHLSQRTAAHIVVYSLCIARSAAKVISCLRPSNCLQSFATVSSPP